MLFLGPCLSFSLLACLVSSYSSALGQYFTYSGWSKTTSSSASIAVALW